MRKCARGLGMLIEFVGFLLIIPGACVMDIGDMVYDWGIDV